MRVNNIGAGGLLRPLIDFDMIFDINLSVLNLIQKEYNDSSVFNSDILNNMSLEDWKSLLHVNPYKNPLYILMSDFDKADKLFDEIMEERKDYIYNNLYRTDIFNFVHLMKISAGIIPTILCKNEFEANVVERNRDELPNKVEISSLSNINLSNYNVLYLKYCTELIDLNNIKGFTIYIADDLCNFDIKDEELYLQPQSIIKKLESTNKFKVISRYSLK